MIRIVGSWAARPQSSDTDGSIVMAILMLSSDAFSGGAVPALDTDLASFMYLKSMFLREGDLAGVGRQYTTMEFDIKTKRRFRSPDNVLTMIHTNTSPGALSITFTWALRTLLYIP